MQRIPIFKTFNTFNEILCDSGGDRKIKETLPSEPHETDTGLEHPTRTNTSSYNRNSQPPLQKY